MCVCVTVKVSLTVILSDVLLKLIARHLQALPICQELSGFDLFEDLLQENNFSPAVVLSIQLPSY